MGSSEIFKKKTHGYLAVLIVSIILFLLNFSLWYDNKLGLTFFILGSIAIAAFINIYRSINWRCPSCNTFLSSSVYIENCPNCNCRLTADKKSGVKNTYFTEEELHEDYAILKAKIQIPESLHNYEKLNIYN